MATSYIQALLSEHEEILLETHQHWFLLFGRIFLEIVLAAALIVGVVFVYSFYPVAIYGLILVLVPLAGIVRDVLIWRNNAYIVTNRRVFQSSGVLDKKVVDSSLDKVNDIKLTQSFLGRLFDYGDIEILTASELGVDLFHQISEPVEFKTTILNAKEKLDYAEAGVRPQVENDIPALIEKLDGLRKKGIISEEEFEKKKSELLAKM